MTGSIDGNGLLDPDEAVDYLQRWKGRIDQMAADTKAMSDRLSRLQVSAEDGDGLATVTIDSTGVLVDLQLSHRTQRIAPDVVARAVLRAQRTAQQQAAEQSRAIIVETMGPDSVAARTIADRIDRQLQQTATGDPAGPVGGERSDG